MDRQVHSKLFSASVLVEIRNAHNEDKQKVERSSPPEFESGI